MPEPASDVDVTLKDFEIVMPNALAPGAHTLKVTNAAAHATLLDTAPGRGIEAVAPPLVDLAPPCMLGASSLRGRRERGEVPCPELFPGKLPECWEVSSIARDGRSARVGPHSTT